MNDRYGRFWHLPLGLYSSGHKVWCACASYYKETGSASISFGPKETGASLEWQSVRVFPYSPLSWRKYTQELERRARELDIDLIIAASDGYQIIVGHRLSKRLRIPLVADFYDNFESYGATKVPGVRPLLRRATRGAQLVTCVSSPLKDKLIVDYGLPPQRVVIMENAVEPLFFSQLPRADARDKLGLPVQGRIIGTAGELAKDRDVGNLVQAFLDMARDDEALYLALAGDLSFSLPDHPRIHYLGRLEHNQVCAFWRALDVAAVCVKDNEFGRYCFPQKAAEIAAAGVPMVFPAIGVMNTNDVDGWGERIGAGGTAAWTESLRKQLNFPEYPRWRPDTWQQLSNRFSEQIQLMFSENARDGSSAKRPDSTPPMISVITVCLNPGKYLQQTIDSVANQQYRDYEHIVVDGGSTDGTVAVLMHNADKLASWASEPDQGIADAMNKGAKLARGRYLYFLNADDFLLNPTVFSNVAASLSAQPDILSCAVLFRTENRDYIKRAHGFSFLANFKQAVMHQGTFCSRYLFEKLGGFDPTFRICMDFDFFLRAKIAGAFLAKSDYPLAVMRDTGISSQREWPVLRRRLLEEKRAHFANRGDKLVWRYTYFFYWSLYWPYKRIKSITGN